jgi:hypothetical protein
LTFFKVGVGYLNTMNDKLINSDKVEVKVGQRVLTFRGELVEVVGWRAGTCSASSGRVMIKDAMGHIRECFPSVIGCEIVVN